MPFPEDPRLGWFFPTEHYKAAALWPASRHLQTLDLSSQPTDMQWTHGPIRDQGQIPACVGYTGWDNEFTAPNASTDDRTDPDGLTLYHEAQANDGFPMPHDGSTILGLCKALNKRGMIGSYLWATVANDVVTWLLNKGPLMLGTNWYDGMMSPDASGTIHATGSVRGGHAYELWGVHTVARYFDGINHWGDWGPLHGEFRISFDDVFALLFQQAGECAGVLEPAAPTPPPIPPAGADIRDHIDVGLNRLDWEAIQRITRDGHLRNFGEKQVLHDIIDNKR